MPRPKTKPRKLLVRMTDAEHAGVLRRAAGGPMGPRMVADTLAWADPSALLAALEAGPVATLVADRSPMARQALAAVQSLRQALRA